MTQSFNIECVQIYCNELMISFTVIHFYSIARDMLDLGSFYFCIGLRASRVKGAGLTVSKSPGMVCNELMGNSTILHVSDTANSMLDEL